MKKELLEIKTYNDNTFENLHYRKEIILKSPNRNIKYLDRYCDKDYSIEEMIKIMSNFDSFSLSNKIK